MQQTGRGNYEIQDPRSADEITAQKAHDQKVIREQVKKISAALAKATTSHEVSDAFYQAFREHPNPFHKRETLLALEEKYFSFFGVLENSIQNKRRLHTTFAAYAYDERAAFDDSAEKMLHRQQMLTLTRAAIGHHLGPSASPLTKAFVAAAEQLTPLEYSSTEVHDKPMRSVLTTIGVQKGLIQVNPLTRSPSYGRF